MTIEENVSLIPRLTGWSDAERRQRSIEVLELIGLDPEEFRHRYPDELSGGQQQRIGVAPEEDAAKRNRRTISDLASAAGELRAGFTAEFSERPDGYPGLKKAYDFSFGKVVNLDPAIMDEAIREEQVDVFTAFSTDSRIEGYNLVLLEDDRKYSPPIPPPR